MPAVGVLYDHFNGNVGLIEVEANGSVRRHTYTPVETLPSRRATVIIPSLPRTQLPTDSPKHSAEIGFSVNDHLLNKYEMVTILTKSTDRNPELNTMSYGVMIWKKSVTAKDSDTDLVLAATEEDRTHPAMERFDAPSFVRDLQSAFGGEELWRDEGLDTPFLIHPMISQAIMPTGLAWTSGTCLPEHGVAKNREMRGL